MCVLLLDLFKHLLLRKTDVLKTCRKSKFLGKKIRRNALALKSKKVQSISGKVYFGIIIFSCLSSTKLCLRFLLNCFVQEIKGFYQSSIGHEVYFRDIMNVSSNTQLKIKIREMLGHIRYQTSLTSQVQTQQRKQEKIQQVLRKIKRSFSTQEYSTIYPIGSCPGKFYGTSRSL